MFDRLPPDHRGPDPKQDREREQEDPAQVFIRREHARRQLEEHRRREAERRKAEEAERAADEAYLAGLAPAERERVLAEREAKRQHEAEAREAERAAAREKHEAAQKAHREAEAKQKAEEQAKRDAREKELQAQRDEHQRQRQAKDAAEREAEAKRKAEAEVAQLARDREELARYERDHHHEISDGARQRLSASPSDAARVAAADARAEERHAAELAELRAAQEANRQAGQQLRANVRAAVAAALPRLEPLRAARRAGKLHEDALVPITRAIFAAIGEVVAASTHDQTLAHRLRAACSAHAYTLDALDQALEELPADIERAFGGVAADARAPLIAAQPSPSTLAQRIEQASGETLHAHASAYAQEKAEAEAPAKLDEGCSHITPQLIKLLRARGVADPEAWMAQARARWFDERGAIKAEVLAENERARGALRVFIVNPRMPWHAHRGAIIEGFTLMVEHDLAAYPQAQQKHAEHAEAARDEKPGHKAGASDISRHADGKAPPNWGARVVASLPSEAVVTDDPGHRYHVLDDGMAIAASEPHQLKPEVADKAKQVAPSPKSPADELAPYGVTVDEFKDYCKHHKARGWDGYQAAGWIDQFFVARNVEKIPEDVRKRVRHALFHQGDQTLVMEEIGGAAVIGTRQENAERRADLAAQMEGETLANMTGGIFGAVAGGIQQWLTPDDRAKIHAASGVGAGIDNIILSLGMKGEGPRFEPPPEFGTYQHGAPTHEVVEAHRGRPSAAEEHPQPAQPKQADAELSGHVAPAVSPAKGDSVDTFVSGNVPKAGPARWKYIENPDVWSPSRRALHEKLLAEAKREAQTFADAFEPGQQPTLYAMRGNTAAGKSRAAKQNPALAGPMSKAPKGSINPDNFKARLAAEGGFSSSDVHSESSMLATRLEKEIVGIKRTSDGAVGDIVVDKRLATVEDVTSYAKMAKESGRAFHLTDVDAPLETSLAGVLERSPGGDDPLPPFDVVGGGFSAVRTNRLAVIRLFTSEPSFGEYELYATTPSGERVKAAEVVRGKLNVLDERLFAQATEKPADDAVAITADTRITEDVIAKVTANLEPKRAAAVRATLEKYSGRSWKAALEAHSHEKGASSTKDTP